MPPPYRGRQRGRGGSREEDVRVPEPKQEVSERKQEVIERGSKGRGGYNDARGRGRGRGRGSRAMESDSYPTDSETTSKIHTPVAAGAPTPLCQSQTPTASDHEDSYQTKQKKGKKGQKVHCLTPSNFEPVSDKPVKKSKEPESPPPKSAFANRGLRPVGTESAETAGSETPKRGNDPFDRRSPVRNDPLGGTSGLVVGSERYSYPSEKEFLHARSIIQEATRPVLVGLLTSIVDDFPAMANLIRQRYERAVSSPSFPEAQRAEVTPSPLQEPPRPSPSNARNPFYVQPSTFSHTQFYGSQVNYPNQFGTVAAYRQSPPPVSSQLQRIPSHQSRFAKNRLSGSALDDQEICSVHGATRSIKHLHRNEAGHLACIPGFHCLESSKNNSTAPTPTKESPPTNVNDDGFTVTSGHSHHDAFSVASAFSSSHPSQQQPEDDGRLKAIFDMFK